MSDAHAYRPLLLSGHWFSHLPAELQDALLDAASLRRLDAGQRLFSRGDKPCGLYAVVAGSIRIGAVSQTGKEALLTLIEPPYWFGEIALFDGQPRTHDAYADGPCVLLSVPQAALLALLERQPQHWRDFALLLSQKLRLAFIALEEMSLLPAAPRLARRLVMIAEGYGEVSGERRLIHLAQEQLALMLAISRQTTNQILKDLEAQGVLRLTYGEIEILDLERLRQVGKR
ncbi:Crp/Fnr family transcriptional regulator [Pseudomonas cavernae]|uniref:Crp/Fnr family transcriptional regulator n=1 Tax=Pseudomonas cavernae TaxID=2320867 RepID=A0A385YW93_9PSED|nr:Crp/Fnr family transcriptional regulator [Pseudomonas cavernae]AYC30966.1 Crp/Fnr family transcriptional regulator [Pseudomonas cavernae]